MAILEMYKGHYLWRYIPSFPAAIVFIAVFGVLTLLHFWRLFRHRTWFCIPFVVGGIFEVVGYVGRALAHDSTGKVIPYVLQSIFLLLAPILFAASLYMTLSRVIRSVNGESYSIIPTHWLTRIFVAGDIFSFFVQACGAGLRVHAGQGKNKMNPNLGSYVIVGGLIFQIAVFAVFIVTAMRFHQAFKKQSVASKAKSLPWEQILYMLYGTSGLVLTRNIYRVAEYAMGSNGYLLGHEWGVFVFDAALMTLTMMAFFVWYPSQLKQTMPSDDGSVESGATVEVTRRSLEI